MVATAAQAVDVLLLVAMYFVYKGFIKYLDVRADIYDRRLRLMMEKIQSKNG
jgi:hypothetical protein